MPSDSSATDNSTEVLVGKCKWFNNRAGYGFLTVLGDNKGNKKDEEDIFVHHTSLITQEDHYNYLVQGEYVWFTKEKTADKTHEYQAGNVTGLYGDKMLCETRHEKSKDSNDEWKNVSHSRRPRSNRKNT